MVNHVPAICKIDQLSVSIQHTFFKVRTTTCTKGYENDDFAYKPNCMTHLLMYTYI